MITQYRYYVTILLLRKSFRAIGFISLCMLCLFTRILEMRFVNGWMCIRRNSSIGIPLNLSIHVWEVERGTEVERSGSKPADLDVHVRINLRFRVYIYPDMYVVAYLIHQENMSVKCIPPYTPLLYRKTGVRRGIPNFLFFFIQNIHCGYSLEPPRQGGSNVYPQCMF